MITRLDVSNFRRVADAELIFGPDDHLVVIEGQNGAGKSSLVEALAWALTGESRHGRRGLDNLVRRGAELEGAAVTVEFNHAGASWRVERTRVDSVTKAVLYCDASPVCDTPSAVDAELARIMGMDAAGFRLAVLARQRELAGLTSMDRRARKQSLARLLGVEALSRAANKAHEKMTGANQIVAAMGVEPDVGAARDAAAAAAAAAEGAEAAADAANDEVQRLRAEASNLADAAAAAEEAAAATVRAEAALAAARDTAAAAAAEVAAADAALAQTPPPPPVRAIDEVLAELRDVEAQISSASATAAMLSERAATAAELDEVRTAIAALTTELDDMGDPAAALTAAEASRAEIVASGTDARAAARAAADEVAATRTRLAAVAERTESYSDLSGVCDRCGQDVGEEHIESLHARAASEAAELNELLEVRVAAAAAAEARLEDLRAQLGVVDSEIAGARSAVTRLEQLTHELTALQRRESTYAARLARPAPEAPENPDALAEVRERLNAELVDVRAAADTAAAHAAAAQKASEARARADAAAGAVSAAAEALTGTALPDEVAAAAARYEELTAAANSEAELAVVLAERAAAERRRADELEVRAAEISDFAQRWALRRTDARVAAHAKALLWDCHDTLSAGLRPALESTIAQMVARLSDGRFSEVKVSDDYEVTVRDNTAWRNLSELSGGEQDLVALAVRLALSIVVSERAMGAAPSLLVLDEVFGSQDGLRRETIMSALRDLRDRWSQVWLISHVGGLAEVADRVVEISIVDDPDITGETRSDITVT